MLQAAGRNFAKGRYREIEIGILLEAFETAQARLEEILHYCRVNREKETTAQGEREETIKGDSASVLLLCKS